MRGLPPQVCGCGARVYFRKKPGGRAIAIDADSKRLTVVTDEGEVAKGFKRHECGSTNAAITPPQKEQR